MCLLSIIIPTKDRLAILKKTLKHLGKALNGINFDYELLIISNSKQIEVVSDIMPEAKVLENPKNKNSVFCSRNYGVGTAKGEIILLLDDDIIIPDSKILDRAIQFHQKCPKSCFNPDWIYPKHLQDALAQQQFGRYLQHFGYTSRKTQSDDIWQENIFETKDIASFFFCIKKSDYELIGGYDENIPFEGTDHDISKRLRDAGIKIYTEPDLMVYHNEEDRQDMKAWLMRQYRMGGANRVAYKNGLLLTKINYSLIKRVIFHTIYHTKGIFFALLSAIPNQPHFDRLSFKIINILQGAHICAGYYSIQD